MTLPETNTIPGIAQVNQDAINILKPTIKLCPERRRCFGVNCRRRPRGDYAAEIALMLAGFKQVCFSGGEHESTLSNLPLPLHKYGIETICLKPSGYIYYTEQGTHNALLFEKSFKQKKHNAYLTGILLEYPLENIEYFYKQQMPSLRIGDEHARQEARERWEKAFINDKQEAEAWLAQQDIKPAAID